MANEQDSWGNINFNLIRSLHALLEECNVTNAAMRCDVTQSAMSISLKKLRQHFNNELLVKDTKGNYVMTAFAHELKDKVYQAMLEFDDVFSHQEHFEPEKARKKIVIGMSDYVGFVVLPKLIKALQHSAPGIDIVQVGLNHLESIEDFHRLQLDFAIGNFTHVPSSLYTTNLFQDEGVIAASINHPLMRKETITTEDVVTYPQVFVSLEKGIDENFIVNQLRNEGYRVKVKLITPHTLLALQTLPNTLLVTNTVKRLVEPFKESLGLATRPTPYSLRKYQANLYWLPQHHQSKLHQWFRGELKRVLSGSVDE